MGGELLQVSRARADEVVRGLYAIAAVMQVCCGSLLALWSDAIFGSVVGAVDFLVTSFSISLHCSFHCVSRYYVVAAESLFA